ncbi:MAG TPA: uracil phosphoribosyltransferase [Saprospiraceae bacterium]|nr:uracil phosphoribosyltransferase [Saprospiraceae bacterium]HQW54654.1 uracil phosphoribosyltransferase [Saprospiraceae bacterium]
MVTLLTQQKSLFGNLMHELREVDIQSNRRNFRQNLEKFGLLAGYEISKLLNYEMRETTTVLGSTEVDVLHDEVVALAILRAGLPLQAGILKAFDDAEGAFVTAYRKEKPDGSFDISMDYITCPILSNKVIVMADPMLATGRSIEAAMHMINDYGKPREIHLVSVIASESGIDHIRRLYPFIHIWVGAIDAELTAKSYIVPGLGDAGDLSFGEKLQG